MASSGIGNRPEALGRQTDDAEEVTVSQSGFSFVVPAAPDTTRLSPTDDAIWPARKNSEIIRCSNSPRKSLNA
jgi:hypothetical protein